VFKKIVWATDGSENADPGLELAKSLAAEAQAKLVILHIVQKLASSKDTALGWYADEEIVEAKLKKIESALSDEKLDVTLRIQTHVGPQAAHDIADVAREEGADLIVVGSRGHGSIPGLLLGNDTQRLLHLTPCPVLVVGARASGGEE
jgi:nucleotide-binding universal stress UspA family protein